MCELPRRLREGLDLLPYVRSTSPSTRTLLLTAYGSAELEVEARRRGADAVLRKPKPLAEIAQLLSALLEAP